MRRKSRVAAILIASMLLGSTFSGFAAGGRVGSQSDANAEVTATESTADKEESTQKPENSQEESRPADETEEEKIPQKPDTSEGQQNQEKPVVKPVRKAAKVATPPQAEERFLQPNTWMDVEEGQDGTRSIYGYWDLPDSEEEPVAIALQMIQWKETNGKLMYWPGATVLEGYYEESVFSNEGDHFRTNLPLNALMSGSGTYQIMVSYIMNEEDVPESGSAKDLPDEAWDSGIGERFDYSAPKEQVAGPTNVQVDSAGRLSWDCVDGVAWYDVRLYIKGSSYDFEKNTLVYALDKENVEPTSFFPNILETGVEYRYGVKAVSPDCLEYQDSDYVKSDYFEIGETNEIINDLLTMEDEELQTAVESGLSEDDMEDMRTQLLDKGIEISYQELEERYLAASGKEAAKAVSEDGVVNTESVNILGGAMNQITEVSFKQIKTASASEARPELGEYTNLICMDISAVTENGDKSELDWPVLITMPAPENIPIGLLKIRHYRNDGKVDTIEPRNNGDGTISFAISHFSLFAFYQEHSSGGSSGGGGGTSAPRVSANGTWHQDNTGWWFEKNGGGYPSDSWYECYWNGQMNWYHFNAQGYLDAGWFTDKDGQTYFLHDQHDNRFGYMYTDWNWIGGKCYYFTKNQTVGGPSVGALVRNGQTPDGYTVNENGEWIVNGEVQTR